MTWQRLESATVGIDLYEGQEAKIADGMWMIGRQWQVGELTGDDAASPMLVEAEIEFTPVTRFQAGPPEARAPVVDVDSLVLPLETAAEREHVRSGPSALRLAAEAGLQLFRLLEEAEAPAGLRARLRKQYPLTLPDDDGLDSLGRAELRLLLRRSFDARALRIDDDLDPALQAGSGLTAWSTWTRWYDSIFSEPTAGESSWQRSRMEYRFRVSARPDGEEVVLDAPEYVGGHLDWHTFDVRSDLPPLAATEVIHRRSVRSIPTRATFAGQAASRWWQMEDATVWFGDIHAAPEDLARVALAAFGMVFGADWFVIPGRLPVGHLVRARSVRVHDSFERSHPIRSCAELDGPDRVWRFFELSGDGSADAPTLADRTSPWTFLAPALAGVTESPPAEEVVFARDEVANVGWAAELRVESNAGRVVDRVARAKAAHSAPPHDPSPAWRYRLTQPVPGHMIPLLAVRLSGQGGLYLQRGRLATSSNTNAANAVDTQGAFGHILEPNRQLLIEDSEVPTSGVRVTRSWQMARSQGGGFVLWMGRRKSIPPPRRSPGLIFDEVDRRQE